MGSVATVLLERLQPSEPFKVIPAVAKQFRGGGISPADPGIGGHGLFRHGDRGDRRGKAVGGDRKPDLAGFTWFCLGSDGL